MRIRRFTCVIDGNAVTGARNLDHNPGFTVDKSRGDNQDGGMPVIMSKEPTGSFELLDFDSNCVSGYFTSMVFTYKSVSVANGAETVTDKTITLSNGTLVVSTRAPIDGPGGRNVAYEAQSAVEA